MNKANARVKDEYAGGFIPMGKAAGGFTTGEDEYAGGFIPAGQAGQVRSTAIAPRGFETPQAIPFPQTELHKPSLKDLPLSFTGLPTAWLPKGSQYWRQRAASEIIEKPIMGLMQLPFSATKWAQEKAGQTVDPNVQAMFDKLDPYQSGFVTPKVQETREWRDLYFAAQRSKIPWILNRIEETGFDFASFLGSLFVTKGMLGKAGVGAKALSSTKKIQAIRAAGHASMIPKNLARLNYAQSMVQNATLLGIHGVLTSPGPMNERISTGLWRSAYAITPLITAYTGVGEAGPDAVRKVAPRVVDFMFNSLLTSPQYKKMYDAAGGFNIDFLGNAIPQVMMDALMSLTTAGFPETRRAYMDNAMYHASKEKVAFIERKQNPDGSETMVHHKLGEMMSEKQFHSQMERNRELARQAMEQKDANDIHMKDVHDAINPEELKETVRNRVGLRETLSYKIKTEHDGTKKLEIEHNPGQAVYIKEDADTQKAVDRLVTYINNNQPEVQGKGLHDKKIDMYPIAPYRWFVERAIELDKFPDSVYGDKVVEAFMRPEMIWIGGGGVKSIGEANGGAKPTGESSSPELVYFWGKVRPFSQIGNILRNNEKALSELKIVADKSIDSSAALADITKMISNNFLHTLKSEGILINLDIPEKVLHPELVENTEFTPELKEQLITDLANQEADKLVNQDLNDALKENKYITYIDIPKLSKGDHLTEDVTSRIAEREERDGYIKKHRDRMQYDEFYKTLQLAKEQGTVGKKQRWWKQGNEYIVEINPRWAQTKDVFTAVARKGHHVYRVIDRPQGSLSNSQWYKRQKAIYIDGVRYSNLKLAEKVANILTKTYTQTQRQKTKIISGGQTGAGLGALLGAAHVGISTGGTAAAGFKTENGINLGLKHYGLKAKGTYQERTIQNIKDADVTVIFTPHVDSPGIKFVIDTAKRLNKLLLINPSVDALRAQLGKTINITGNRESAAQGLQAEVRDKVVQAFGHNALIRPGIMPEMKPLEFVSIDLINQFRRLVESFSPGSGRVVGRDTIPTKTEDSLGIAGINRKTGEIFVSMSKARSAWDRFLTNDPSRPLFARDIIFPFNRGDFDNFREFYNFIVMHERVHLATGLTGGALDENIVNMIALERMGKYQQAAIIEGRLGQFKNKNKMPGYITQNWLARQTKSVPAMPIKRERSVDALNDDEFFKEAQKYFLPVNIKDVDVDFLKDLVKYLQPKQLLEKMREYLAEKDILPDAKKYIQKKILPNIHDIHAFDEKVDSALENFISDWVKPGFFVGSKEGIISKQHSLYIPDIKEASKFRKLFYYRYGVGLSKDDFHDLITKGLDLKKLLYDYQGIDTKVEEAEKTSVDFKSEVMDDPEYTGYREEGIVGEGEREGEGVTPMGKKMSRIAPRADFINIEGDKISQSLEDNLQDTIQSYQAMFEARRAGQVSMEDFNKVTKAYDDLVRNSTRGLPKDRKKFLEKKWIDLKRRVAEEARLIEVDENMSMPRGMEQFAKLEKLYLEESPNKQTQEIGLMLKLANRLINFFGPKTQGMKEWVDKKIQERNKKWEVSDEIIRALISNKRYGEWSHTLGLWASDAVITTVNDAIKEEYPNVDFNIKENRVWLKRLSKHYRRILVRALEEIHYEKGDHYLTYSRTGIGRKHAFIDEQQKQDFLENYIKMADGVGKTLPQEYYDGTLKYRPELAYFNLLLNPKMKALAAWIKSKVEAPVLSKLIDSGVLDSSDLVHSIDRGFSHRFWVLSKNQRGTGRGAAIPSTYKPKKKFLTYDEFYSDAKREGYDAIDDAAMSIFDYVRGSYDLANLKTTIEMVKSAPHPDDALNSIGLKAVEYSDPKVTGLAKAAGMSVEKYLTDKGYVQAKSLPGFSKRHGTGFYKPWVHRSIVDMVESVYDHPHSLQSFNKVNGFVKRMVMFSPNLFALNMASTPFAWRVTSEPIKAIKSTFLPIIRLDMFFKGASLRPKEGVGQMDHILAKNYDMGLVEGMIKNGLNPFSLNWFQASLYDRAGETEAGKHPFDKTDVQNAIEHIVGSRFGIDKWAFNDYVANNLYQYFKLIYNRLLPQSNGDKELAMRRAAQFVSDTTGAMDRAIYGREGPFLQALLFARNFTMSYMRQITGALYPVLPEKVRSKIYGHKAGGIGSYFNSLFHGEKTKADMDVLGKYYINQLSRVVLQKVLLIGMLQLGMQAAFGNDDQQEDDYFWFKNEPGKKLMIKTPWKDERGASVYIDPLLYREANQLLDTVPIPNVGRGAGKWFKGKLSYGLNQVIDQLSNTDYKGDRITSDYANLFERVSARGRHALVGSLPSFARPSERNPLTIGLTQTMGVPVKKGRPLGPNTSWQTAQQISRILGRERWLNDRKNQARYRATHKELVKMLFSPDPSMRLTMQEFKNEILRRRNPQAYQILKNAKLLREKGWQPAGE